MKGHWKHLAMCAPMIALADERAALPWRSRSPQAARQLYQWYRAGYVELA